MVPVPLTSAYLIRHNALAGAARPQNDRDEEVEFMTWTTVAFGMPSMGELAVILAIILVLFGASRIPEIARSLGKGIKEFKASVKDEEPDQKDKEE